MAVTEPEAVMPQAVITDEMIASMTAKAGGIGTLGHERGAMGHSAFGGAGILSTERLIGLVHAMGQQDDPVIRDEFGEMLSHLRAARYTQQVMAAQARSGEAPGP